MYHESFEDVKNLSFIKFGLSQLTFWHSPKNKQFKDLKKIGISLIISVQSENTEKIQENCMNNDIGWLEVPIDPQTYI